MLENALLIWDRMNPIISYAATLAIIGKEDNDLDHYLSLWCWETQHATCTFYREDERSYLLEAHNPIWAHRVCTSWKGRSEMKMFLSKVSLQILICKGNSAGSSSYGWDGGEIFLCMDGVDENYYYPPNGWWIFFVGLDEFWAVKWSFDSQASRQWRKLEAMVGLHECNFESASGCILCES